MNNLTISGDDPIVYSPEGQALRCSQVIAMRGGWENISAEESAQLNSLGCYPGFIDLGVSDVAASELSPQGGISVPPTYSTGPINDPGEKFSEEIPLWTSFVPEGDMAGINFGAIVSDPFISTVPMQTGNGIAGWSSFLGQIGPEIGKVLIGEGVRQLAEQIPQYQVQVTPGASCWDHPMKNGRINRRARVKIVRNPDGSSSVLRYCAPRRMNPCNARALGRAARRLSMFQSLSKRVEKVIQRSLKAKPARRSYSRSGCAPKCR